MGSLLEKWTSQKQEVNLEELLEFVREHKRGDDPLKNLAEAIKEKTREEGSKKTAFSYPASFENALRLLKKYGQRETGYKNMSLMVCISVLEFLNRHENNPQPRLTDSIGGIGVPSSVRENLTDEFVNELRNLPPDLRKQKLLKNAKYLALSIEHKEPSEGNGQEEDLVENEASVSEEVEREKEDLEKYRPRMWDLQNAIKENDVEKMKELLDTLPSVREVPRPYKEIVWDAERKVEREKKSRQWQKRLEEQEEKRLEELKKMEGKKKRRTSVVSSPEELYSDGLLRYKRAIALAKDGMERGDASEEDMDKVESLLEDLTLKGAPNSKIERELRHLKETLNIK